MYTIEEYKGNGAEITELCYQFSVEYFSKVYGEIKKESVNTMVCNLFKGGAIITVAKNNNEIIGLIAGLITPVLFDNSEKEYTELVWYVKPEHRRIGIKLLAEAEKIAKDKGCKYIKMAYVWSEQGEKVHAYLEKKGYKPSETYTVKAV